MILHILADKTPNPHPSPSEFVQTYPLLFPVMSPVYAFQYPQEDTEAGFLAYKNAN